MAVVRILLDIVQIVCSVGIIVVALQLRKKK